MGERHDDCVHGLYVDPDHATQGVGRLLMSHAEEQIRLAGFGSVVLHASRNAERFYLACGFKPTGPVASDDGLPMIKPLG